MPFTLSHPFFIYPLAAHQRYFSSTGLIAGSLAPDYFMFLSLNRFPLIDHTILNISCSIIIAIIISFVYQNYVKFDMITHLPFGLDMKYSGYASQEIYLVSRGRFLPFLLSILLGVGWHLAIDSATHYNGVVANYCGSFFLSYLFCIMGKDIYVYDLLQFSLSGIGFFGLLWWLFSRNYIEVGYIKVAHYYKGLYALRMIGVAFLIFALRGCMGMPKNYFIDIVVITSMSGIGWGLLYNSWVLRRR